MKIEFVDEKEGFSRNCLVEMDLEFNFTRMREALG